MTYNVFTKESLEELSRVLETKFSDGLDPIGFLMQYADLSFTEAIEILAKKLHVKIERKEE